MPLASPIWLIALVPWTALAALLLIGRRERRAVPFLDLWPKDARPPKTRRQLSLPPLPIWLALLAALLAILAAAGPMVHRPGPRTVTVILDAGQSMSGLVPHDKPGTTRPTRFRQVAVQLAAELKKFNEPELKLKVITLPGAKTALVLPSKLHAFAATTPATAMNTGQELNRLVRRAMAESEEPILVMTDQPLDVQDTRVTAAAPIAGGNSVGISTFQLRRSPQPQAMVRLQSTHWGGPGGTPLPAQIRIRITFGGSTLERDLPTPPLGTHRDEFIDLPTSNHELDSRRLDIASAELVGLSDDLPADDAAFLTSDIDWPNIEPGFAIGELSRLVGVYQKDRPAGERSVHLRLVDRAESLGTAAGVIFSASIGEPTNVTNVVDHPVSSAVQDWSQSHVRAGSQRDIPSGFTTILSDARGPLVAVREADALAGGTRQVCVALATEGWADRAEYVTFFAGLFDWVGRVDKGGERMAARPIDELTSAWSPIQAAPGPGPVAFWPGIYERKEDSRREAFGMMFGNISLAAKQTPPTHTIAEISATSEHRMPLAPWLLVLALAMLVAAVGLWPRQSSPVAKAS